LAVLDFPALAACGVEVWVVAAAEFTLGDLDEEDEEDELSKNKKFTLFLIGHFIYSGGLL